MDGYNCYLRRLIVLHQLSYQQDRPALGRLSDTTVLFHFEISTGILVTSLVTVTLPLWSAPFRRPTSNSAIDGGICPDLASASLLGTPPSLAKLNALWAEGAQDLAYK